MSDFAVTARLTTTGQPAAAIARDRAVARLRAELDTMRRRGGEARAIAPEPGTTTRREDAP